MVKWVYIESKYYYSEDNFVTYNSSNEFSGEWEEEKNEDIKARVKILIKYGSNKGKIILAELDAIREMLEQLHPEICYRNTGYGHEFEVFVISVLHHLTYAQAITKVIHGNNDGTVDAIVDDGDVAFAYQIKLDKLNDPNVIYQMKQNINSIIKGETSTDTCTDLKDYLYANKELLKKRYDYRTISENNSSDTNITPSTIFKLYFDNLFLPHENNNLELYLPIEKYNVYVDKAPIKDATNYTYLSSGTEKPASVFIFVNAEKLIENLLQQGVTPDDDRLFYDNIRGKLGENKAIQNTILEHPEMFVIYNNGLSIIGEWKQQELEFVIKNPSWVNGQQTLFNLLKAKERKVDLSKITLPVFIKKAETAEEKQNIALYNNSQKAVKDIDLLSLKSNIREIQKYLLDKAYERNFGDKSYYLKIISSGEKGSDKILKMLFSKHNIIPLAEFVRMNWIVDNKKQLGDWKNNISKMIKSEYLDKTYSISIDKCERVCELIVTFKQFLEQQTPSNKKIYKNCDVAFMYLINSFSNKKYSVTKAKRIIDYINETIFERKRSEFAGAKLIDLYKSNEIMDNIKEAKKALGY